MRRGASCCGDPARHQRRPRVGPRQRSCPPAVAPRRSTQRSMKLDSGLRTFASRPRTVEAESRAGAGVARTPWETSGAFLRPSAGLLVLRATRAQTEIQASGRQKKRPSGNKLVSAYDVEVLMEARPSSTTAFSGGAALRTLRGLFCIAGLAITSMLFNTTRGFVSPVERYKGGVSRARRHQDRQQAWRMG